MPRYREHRITVPDPLGEEDIVFDIHIEEPTEKEAERYGWYRYYHVHSNYYDIIFEGLEKDKAIAFLDALIEGLEKVKRYIEEH